MSGKSDVSNCLQAALPCHHCGNNDKDDNLSSLDILDHFQQNMTQNVFGKRGS